MRGKLHRLITIILVAILLVSGAMVFRQWQADKKAKDEYDRLAQMASQTAEESNPGTGTAGTGSAEAQPDPEPYVTPNGFQGPQPEHP